MKALIVHKQWLDKIFDCENPKLWEMRASITHVRGQIALIEAGSGTIVGETTIIDCREPLTEDAAVNFQHLHQVTDLDLLRKWRYPWVLYGSRRYKAPIPYNHPKGAVIWVDLEKAALW